MVPRGYEFNQIPRKSGRRGGGIGILYKSVPTVTVSKSETTEMYTYFANMDCIINIGKVTVKVCIIYRPPPKQNDFRNSIFFNKWYKYLDKMTIIPYDVIITRYLNFHMNNKYNVENILSTVQLTNVISRESSPFIVPSIFDPCVSINKGKSFGDHLAVEFIINMGKTDCIQRKNRYIKYGGININIEYL